jgi:hypothetical protein
MYDILKLLALPPLRFHCIGECWDQTLDCCVSGIDSQTLYNHSARSDTQTEQASNNLVTFLWELALVMVSISRNSHCRGLTGGKMQEITFPMGTSTPTQRTASRLKIIFIFPGEILIMRFFHTIRGKRFFLLFLFLLTLSKIFSYHVIYRKIWSKVSLYQIKCTSTKLGRPLKVYKIEIFFGFDFEICIISLLVMSKY